MLISWIQLICGLTRANKPWKNVFNFKNYFCSLCDWNICLNFFNAMGTQCYLFTIKIYYLNDYINSWDGRLAFYAHRLIERKQLNLKGLIDGYIMRLQC